MTETAASSGRWAADEPWGQDLREVRVVLVRHGESRWNAEGLVQGHVGPGLTEHGQAQARLTALALQARFSAASLIVRSDLLRVAETAEPFESATGLPVLVDARLREVDNGSWAGKPHAQVVAEYPGEIAAIRRGEDVVRGGGESFGQVRARVGKAIRDVVTSGLDHSNERCPTVVVFTHGGPVRVAVADALGLSSPGHQLLDPPGNCSLTTVRQVVGPDRTVVTSALEAYNRTGHLDQLVHPAGSTPGRA